MGGDYEGIRESAKLRERGRERDDRISFDKQQHVSLMLRRQGL